jgi:alkanesulfonate monooxygenase SsuD/methylene tetrahydromethanopterin reductase-like flavin-dependent oxidoreductase (luciferase family)
VTAPARPAEFSISVQNRGVLAEAENLVPLAERADALGYDALWVTDHIVVPFEIKSSYPFSATGQFIIGATGDYLDPLAALSFLAGRTRRIRVGTSILVMPMRHPLESAKALATLDVLSGGRLIVGAGTGWLAEEFAVLGVSFAERVARTEEHLPKPHPPIWIGGHGPRALHRVAELADGWKPMGLRPPGKFEPDEFAGEVRKLRDLAAARDRDPEAISVAIKVPVRSADGLAGPSRPTLAGSPAQIIDDLARYREAGVRHFILDFATPEVGEMHATLNRFAREVRPSVS